MSEEKSKPEKLEYISALIREGQIRLGMTRGEVRACLGEPDELGGTSRRFRVPSIWKYGDIEFVFPSARTVRESGSQGLLYVYIDDYLPGMDGPLYLLKEK